MRAVQLTSFGDPVDGLRYVDIPEPDPPGPNQVLIGVEFSPINPNDLMVARGIYAFRPPLPAVIGNEGAGLPREIMHQMDETLAIPQAVHVESLNAGVAASIVLYEAARNRK